LHFGFYLFDFIWIICFIMGRGWIKKRLPRKGFFRLSAVPGNGFLLAVGFCFFAARDFVYISLFVLAARWEFFVTENWRREQKVLCAARGAVFGIETRLFFGSQQERLRGGRLLFPLRRTSSPKRGDFF
jgi:hypothetical protein